MEKLDLKDSLLSGLLMAVIEEAGEMFIHKNAISDLYEIWDCEDKRTTLECFWNALTNDPAIGGLEVLDIFKPFVEKYPDIAKVLTIYVYA